MEITDDQRRALLVRRQLTTGDTTRAAVRSVLALHATDPATVYLSVLARVPSATVPAVRAALYEGRDLVRMMAMRRTVFVLDRDDVPLVHAAASLGVAATMRTRLLKEVATAPTEPVVDDPAAWLDATEEAVVAHLATVPEATGAQLGEAIPQLRVAVLPRTDKSWDTTRLLTSSVLAYLGAKGRIVRAGAPARWTSRQHTWASAERWWPEGLPELDPAAARVDLARRWLLRFGPATAADLQWWTGWTKTATAAALRALDTVAVELSCGPGYLLEESTLDPADLPPTAAGDSVALLPALDPTPMGWRHRDWYLGEHREPLFDRFGNVGPTIWVRGRIVGGWAVRGGAVVHRLLEPVDASDARRIEAEADRLSALLDSGVTPSFPTPLEKALRTG